MTEYFIVYDAATGAVRYRGTGAEGATLNQIVPEGAAILQVPPAAVAGDDIDLGVIREALVGLVNYEAGQFRLRYITDVPGQQASYLTKEEEAKAFLKGADASECPFLEAEARYTATPIGDVAALVLQTSGMWRVLAAQIEGRRRGAMVALSAANNVAALVAASAVNWNALTAAPATA